MTAATIDLNCDLGEREDAAGIAADLALLECVTSANIACGGHAGDERSMVRTVAAAMERGVALGAHPGYPDRAHFGREAFAMALAELDDAMAAQVQALQRIVVRLGGALTHVKLHGALYHAAMRQPEIAEAVARGIGRLDQSVILVGLAGAPALEAWRAMGFRVAAEAFADRCYESDGSLRDRQELAALIDDPQAAAAQAVGIAMASGLLAREGGFVNIQAETIGLHSDTPHAVDIARAVRTALTHSGIRVEALLR
ncbi:MAG TPA: 5-oxoprolinase subunit PxpA [Phycisphaerae bacterium]|nr:5-oxoprolinase subunit PxpA [Phycisphaerae bacterium]